MYISHLLHLSIQHLLIATRLALETSLLLRPILDKFHVGSCSVSWERLGGRREIMYIQAKRAEN